MIKKSKMECHIINLERMMDLEINIDKDNGGNSMWVRGMGRAGESSEENMGTTVIEQQ